MAAPRANAAPVKIVCIGMGRTGTVSLRVALEKLGFGRPYDTNVILAAKGKDFLTWCKIGDGRGTPEDFDGMFQSYQVIVGLPVLMYPAELYAAYPDAKFILTTRDPAKWEKSIKSTILRLPEFLHSKAEKTELNRLVLEWMDKYMLGPDGYHRGRMLTHTQQELLDHNERVKKIIPPENLLVLEVGDGWDRLVEFLGVPRPTEPYPHLNNPEAFFEHYIPMLD